MVVLKVNPGGAEQHSTTAYIPLKPFLSLCNLLLQVLGLSFLYDYINLCLVSLDFLILNASCFAYILDH